jgi:hypothetical protein
MSPKEETMPPSETSPATLNEDEGQTIVNKSKKPFIEPTVSVSLNILDVTAFFQGTAAFEAADP